MRQYLKYICLLPIILGVITLIAYQFKSPVKAVPSQEVIVETSPVIQREVTAQYQTVGSLVNMDSIDISAEMNGQITAILFKPGEHVPKGKSLIKLDDKVTKSELVSAKAALKLSQLNYQRLQALSKRRLTSEQALDEALADLRAKENLATIKQDQVDKRCLKAPFTGTLGARNISVGQYVNVGQALVRLVSNEKLRVTYTVPERFLSQLKLKQIVELTSEAYPGKTFTGKVSYISPDITPETRTIALEALINNKEHLLNSGLFVQINHQFGGKVMTYLVPEESLMPTISGQKLYVLKNNKALALTVKTGAHHDGYTEVIEGLEQTAQVIKRGQHKLKDGSSVKVTRTDKVVA